MRPKVFAMGLMVVVAIVVAVGSGPVVAGQNANANKRTPRAKTGSTRKASNSQAATPAATEEKPKPKRTARKHARETTGIPSGTGACVAKLEQLASKEPLTPYDKGPEQIINNGLLWNDPHSKCSVGSDQTVRSKVFAVATAWQEKDAAKVQSALAELKSSVPAESAPPTAEPKKPRRRHYAPKTSGAESGEAASASNSNSAKPAAKRKSGRSKNANKNSGA